MPTNPDEKKGPANPPDITVEEVLGAQVGNPPILVNEDIAPTEEVVIAEEGIEPPSTVS